MSWDDMEYASAKLDGFLCQFCDKEIDGTEPGHPRTCGCQPLDGADDDPSALKPLAEHQVIDMGQKRIRTLKRLVEREGLDINDAPQQLLKLQAMGLVQVMGRAILTREGREFLDRLEITPSYRDPRTK